MIGYENCTVCFTVGLMLVGSLMMGFYIRRDSQSPGALNEQFTGLGCGIIIIGFVILGFMLAAAGDFDQVFGGQGGIDSVYGIVFIGAGLMLVGVLLVGFFLWHDSKTRPDTPPTHLSELSCGCVLLLSGMLVLGGLLLFMWFLSTNPMGD